MTYEERLALSLDGSQADEQNEAVTRLVRDHATFVYRVAYSILRDSHDAEDVVQETFVRVVKNVRRLPLIRDQRAWLARITWRAALTKWNRTKKKRNLEIEAAGDSTQYLQADPAAMPSAESDEAVELIERMTSSLPEHLRHPLMLSVIDEMNTREVAEALNITEATVRTRIHRARKLLKEKLRSVFGNNDAF